jgi:iron-sulfur cluster assembly protein
MNITNEAKEFIKKMATKSEGRFLRLGVRAGGCNGYEYFFEWMKNPTDLFTQYQLTEELALCVDPKSMRLLMGSSLEYKDSLMSTGLVITNPNAKSECSCKMSFEA